MKYKGYILCILLALVFLITAGCGEKPEPPAKTPVLSSSPIPAPSEAVKPISAQSEKNLPEEATSSSETPMPSGDTAPKEKPDMEKKPLNGRVIVLDPGHQSVMKNQSVPIAPGASEKRLDFAIGTKGVLSGVFEYEIVLDVSKMLRTELEALGASVIMTRETHDELIGSIERAEIANEAKADVFIRIHCDGVEDESVNGISVLYPGDKYISDKDMLEKSKELSQNILDSVIEETKAKNRGLIKRNDLVGFNYCNVPCTLIEMGFLTNPREDELLNSEDYQKKLVEGMTQGLLEYLGSDRH